jgi:hypothetical protein
MKYPGLNAASCATYAASRKAREQRLITIRM